MQKWSICFVTVQNTMDADFACLRPADDAKLRPRRRKVRGAKERGTIEQAVAIIGLSMRAVQDLAARGEIPGAAKFGRRWTFDLAKLRRHVAAKEQETWQRAQANQSCQRASTGASESFGGARGLTASSDASRWTRITHQARKRVMRSG
jgi:hypothetical protein